MICVVSDTHREAGHGLSGRTLAAVREAAVVVHAGDFTTVAAYDALRGECGRLEAVAGNSDDPALADRLPPVRVVEADGLRLVATHGVGHTETSLSLLGRERDADLVVVGHTHHPAVLDGGPVPILNPGSPTEPRGGPAAHAELFPAERGIGHLVGSSGEPLETFRLERREGRSGE